MIAALLFLGCAAERSETGDALEFLPQSSTIILKLNNPALFFSNLKNNQFLKKNRDVLIPAELQQDLELLDLVEHKAPAYLSFSADEQGQHQFAFITLAAQDRPDSLEIEAVEDIELGSHEVKKLTYNGTEAYSITTENIFLLSNSASLLQESLSKTSFFKDSPDFQKALKAASTEKPVVFINHERAEKVFKNPFFEDLSSFSDWTMLNMDSDQTSLRFDGISTETDTLPKLLNVFRATGTSESRMAAITPASAMAFSSVSYKNFEELQKNLKKHSSKSFENDEKELQLLANSEEVGMIWSKSKVFGIRSSDVEAAQLSLAPVGSAIEEFRGIQIFETGKDLQFEIIKPLLDVGQLKYFAFLSPFIIFSESPAGLEEVILAFQNERVLAKDPSFTAVSENLSSQSSFLVVTKNKALTKGPDNNPFKGLTGLEKVDFEGYPLVALQLIYQDDFAHVHAVLSEGGQAIEPQQVTQKAAVSLAADVATKPYFFRNHRTNGLDIAVQDEQNTLYLISPEGKIYWKKKMDSRIIGEIHSVDLFKNGRIQLAFATQDAIHVIDRDANPVKPFPLEFRDAITQPLGVFDYDNNRDYRFVIVQDRDIYMFNKKGKRVRGFKFDRAAEKIINPLKHIRIGRKDYILAQEASGKLNILSRTGKTRVPVKEEFDFSENEWFEHSGSFVSTNSSGEKLEIDEQGRLKKEDLNLAEEHKIAATEEVFVVLSENELRMGDQQITLDFGLYTAPQIFNLNNKTYISTTDLQAQKVYLFNSEAKLLSGFPIFGNSAIDLGNADTDAAPELVVQGEEDSVLMYDL